MKDNMIDVGTHWSGLVDFQFNAESPVWSDANWRRWPHLSLSQDMGSDGCTAIHAAKFYCSLNVTEYWDESHGICNDINNEFKHRGLMPFVLLTMCAMNLAHVPEKEKDRRFAQMQETLELMFKVNSDHTTCAGFMAHSDRILEEFRSDIEVDETSEPLAALWSSLRVRPPFTLQ